ncbi:MAG TPA: peptide chain release factor 3 [Bacteroides sp.]|nr:peptide chain release factor 3 [Bacteroides sp.]
MKLAEEIQRRRTFAIVSHPDAGKTTLTEKLLLFGGAINVAGAVKSNKIRKTATSDFMEIEKQRGISVATSVMGFEYGGKKVNILDTPGHQDFAEDTYRTLTAVDSVIIVLDAAKGVETQTRKLMDVCRMRKTPVMVFINKMDRPARDSFELLDELEKELGIAMHPVTWPVGEGADFRGVFDRGDRTFRSFDRISKQTIGEVREFSDMEDAGFLRHIAPYEKRFREETALLDGVYPGLDPDDYLKGAVAPVFFGSALNNFGVKELLESFLLLAPHPRPVHAENRVVDPFEASFAGFVFKIHANMDPNHRDRIAFIKVASGRFERNRAYIHVRTGKQMKFSSPTSFMAEKKSVIDEAFPGDIVGVHDTGNFKIGDAVTEGEKLKFKGIPSFSPELFRYVVNAEPMKFKQLARGLEQLTDEGVAQLFVSKLNGRKIIGTVGALQLDVIQYRLQHEYGARCSYEPIPMYKACWIDARDMKQLEKFRLHKNQQLALDREDREVYMSESPYALQMAQEKFPGIIFHFSSEY